MSRREGGGDHAAGKIDWARVPTEGVLPGVSRQVVRGVHQTVVRYRYEPGAVFPVHSYAEEQMTLVLRGRIAFEVAGQPLELGPGDLAMIPGGVNHGATVVGGEPVESINTLSPRREIDPTPR